MTGGRILVRIESYWNSAGLLRQTPGGAGIWEDVSFTTDPVEECDLLVVLNNRKLDDIRVLCPPGNVWAIMQEPYVPGLYDWLIEGHEAYSRVFTHMVPGTGAKYVRSQPAMPWEVGLSYDELTAARCPEKSKYISWIASNLSFLPAHRRRVRLRKHLEQNAPGLVDLFGRGICWIPRKWDALAPYRFSLCIENSVGPDLWTEKVADCFLSWTVPLYMGCANLEEYFPREAFIRIDADDPPGVCERIRQLASSREWEQRLPALEIARRRVLSEYQLFPYLVKLIRTYGLDAGPKREVIVPGYRRRRWLHRLRYIGLKVRNREAADLWDALVSKSKYLWWFRG